MAMGRVGEGMEVERVVATFCYRANIYEGLK
jgi:hypothetical protein